MEKIDLFEKFNTFQIYYRELLKDNIYDNGNLASYIKTYYIENNKILFHVSEILDLSVIVPKGNFDMYQKNLVKKCSQLLIHMKYGYMLVELCWEKCMRKTECVFIQIIRFFFLKQDIII